MYVSGTRLDSLRSGIRVKMCRPRLTNAPHSGNNLPTTPGSGRDVRHSTPEVPVTPKKEFQEHRFSRRERQIMQAVYRTGRATVAEIVALIPDPPTPDAIRRLCSILERKGHLKSRLANNRRVYAPTVGSGKARRKALENVVETFFSGSPHMLVATLLDSHRDRLSPEDVRRLSRMIDEAEKDGRS